MAVICTPGSLIDAATPLQGMNSSEQRQRVLIYLLQQIAANTMTAGQLVDAAKCICGVSEKEMLAIQIFLMCQVVNGGGGGGSCVALSGDGVPTGSVTPQFIGQLYNRNNGDEFYYSTGLTSADWVLISGGGGGFLITQTPDLTQAGNILLIYDTITTSLSFPTLATANAVDVSYYDSLTDINLPALTTVTGYIRFSFCPLLTSFDVSALVNMAGSFDLSSNTVLALIDLSSIVTLTGNLTPSSNPALVTIDLSSLTTLGGSLNSNDCVVLTTVLCPTMIVSNGSAINFNNCALNVTSVNLILARCVASGVTTAIIDLSGGTSAAPTGQGIADKAALILAGNTVTTN